MLPTKTKENTCKAKNAISFPYKRKPRENLLLDVTVFRFYKHIKWGKPTDKTFGQQYIFFCTEQLKYIYPVNDLMLYQ